MRKRMAAAMVALVAALMWAGMNLVSERSVSLMLERERTRALQEEAAIARAVALEIDGGDYARMQQAAQTVQERYGSATLQVALVYKGMAMAGASLPAAVAPLLEASAERATLLDAAGQQLHVAHRLTPSLTLLASSDVSPVYALRNTLWWWTLTLCGAGVVIAALLALGISGLLIRPVRQLARAARALARGEYGAEIPPPSRDELGDLSNAFRAMAQAISQREACLQEQNRRQQRFIDALGHEMRTPLTAIVAGSRLLQQAELPREQRFALLQTLAQEARRLSGMDQRLMTLTRLRQEDMEMQDFSLLEMCREAVGIFDGVTLEGEDTSMTGNRELMIQLVRNLVANALRAGGEAPVELSVTADGLAVRDNGCGMTPEQAAQAFEPFYKADPARTRQAGGAGLGLTLCREIARVHGGTLSLKSRPGEGTCVRYRMAKM